MSKTVTGIAIIVPIMAARVTLKVVNDELARRGHHARLEKGSGYFYSGRRIQPIGSTARYGWRR